MSMNLKSRQITIAPNETLHIHGDLTRKTISLQMPGEQRFDSAICPYGTTDPTPYWLLDIDSGSVGLRATMSHFGEVFIRDVNIAGDETITMISDVYPVVTIIPAP